MYIYIYIQTCYTVVKGNLYEVPENKSAAKGERVKFTCATDHSDELLQLEILKSHIATNSDICFR